MAWIDGEEVEPDILTQIDVTLELMTKRQRDYWEAADLQVAQPMYERPVTGLLDIGGFKTVEILEAGNCTFWFRPVGVRKFIQCHRPAGYRTLHEGVGVCYIHRGNEGSGLVNGALLMAHAYAEELNVTPWEALLSQVRLLANQVEWLRTRVYNAEKEIGTDAIKPGGIAWEWVVLLEARGERLAKVSKMAIDSGVAERLVRQIELEAQAMFRAAIAALDATGIEGVQRELFLERMAGKLLEIEGEHTV